MPIEFSKTKKQRKQHRKTGQTIQVLWENYKRYNIYVMGIAEGKRKKTTELLETIMPENFPKVMSVINSEKKAQRTPSRKKNAKQQIHHSISLLKQRKSK